MPHNGLPVSGYRPQSNDAVELVNDNKQLEERVLRQIDDMVRLNDEARGSRYDHRFIDIARTHIEMGFMALNRAVFQPARVDLVDDGR
jgi:hypothetical protein